MTRVLFICGKNRCRSPTAEVVIGRLPGVQADSAGVRKDADVVVSREQVAWAELVVLMENRYRKPLQNLVGNALRDCRVVSVDIRDDYEFMDEALVALLLERVPPLLR
jgi:predicted protein tyrosine phosphatase